MILYVTFETIVNGLHGNVGDIQSQEGLGKRMQNTIYEVCHFEQIAQYDPVNKTRDMFIEYVNTLLKKMNQVASSWP